MRVTDLGGGRFRAEFEDLAGGGDQDHNDLVFEFYSQASTVPEPVSMTLLATGLAGMSGAGFLKRRRERKNG